MWYYSLVEGYAVQSRSKPTGSDLVIQFLIRESKYFMHWSIRTRRKWEEHKDNQIRTGQNQIWLSLIKNVLNSSINSDQTLIRWAQRQPVLNGQSRIDLVKTKLNRLEPDLLFRFLIRLSKHLMHWSVRTRHKLDEHKDNQIQTGQSLWPSPSFWSGQKTIPNRPDKNSPETEMFKTVLSFTKLVLKRLTNPFHTVPKWSKTVPKPNQPKIIPSRSETIFNQKKNGLSHF